MNSGPHLEKLDNFVIVLAQPKGAGNVGAIARAMSHFGLSDLRLVAPHCDIKSVEARSMAMSAQPLLASARHYPTLREALEDCAWAVATSRRVGRNRKPTMFPREGARGLLERTRESKVALVFGREDKGLRADEIDLCQERLLIPAIPSSDSFNLSQSALLIFWEIFMEKQTASRHSDQPETIHSTGPLALRDQVEGLVDHLVATLEFIGFVPHNHPERVAKSFRSLIDRIKPSDREVRMMRGVLRQVAWKLFNPPSDAGNTNSSDTTYPVEESPSLQAKRRERLIRNS